MYTYVSNNCKETIITAIYATPITIQQKQRHHATNGSVQTDIGRPICIVTVTNQSIYVQIL